MRLGWFSEEVVTLDGAQRDESVSWWSGKLMKCQLDEMSSWWNVKLMKLQVDELPNWWNEKFKK